MLYGVISDTHSNLEALEGVLKFFKSSRVDGYICCGDIVGYGPNPSECVDRLAELKNLFAVAGNHDLAVLEKMSLDWFNAFARAAVLYTRQVLGEAQRKFLDRLPLRIETAAFSAVHGSPRNPAEEYLLSRQQFLDNLDYFKTSLCFVGHSHMPLAFLMKEPLSQVEMGFLKDGQQVANPKGMRAIFNPGSVGQPRDLDPRASCALYDDQKRLFGIHRVEYAVAKVQKRILAAGLPEFLAHRLSYGQ